MNSIRRTIEESIAVTRRLLEDEYLRSIEKIGAMFVSSLKQGKKILIAGNGGSAADAQHFSAELVGRFSIEREGLPAIALTTNTSVLSAIGNDFSYDQIFSRQLRALGQTGDVFVGITTSGNSKNILDAFRIANERGITTVGLLGRDGGIAASLCDMSLIVPSQNTQYIQEAHSTVIHAWCTLIDAAVVAGVIHPGG